MRYVLCLIVLFGALFLFAQATGPIYSVPRARPIPTETPPPTLPPVCAPPYPPPCSPPVPVTPGPNIPPTLPPGPPPYPQRVYLPVITR